jgi:hypothetical protein
MYLADELAKAQDIVLRLMTENEKLQVEIKKLKELIHQDKIDRLIREVNGVRAPSKAGVIRVGFETTREALILALASGEKCPENITGEKDRCSDWKNCEECWADFVDRVTYGP